MSCCLFDEYEVVGGGADSDFSLFLFCFTAVSRSAFQDFTFYFLLLVVSCQFDEYKTVISDPDSDISFTQFYRC